jgi:hypothetical protein
MEDRDYQKAEELGMKIALLMQEENATPEQGVNVMVFTLAICACQSNIDKAKLLNNLGNNIDRVKARMQ